MKSCFGTIYSDQKKLKFGKPLAGRSFKYTLAARGQGIEIANWLLT